MYSGDALSHALMYIPSLLKIYLCFTVIYLIKSGFYFNRNIGCERVKNYYLVILTIVLNSADVQHIHVCRDGHLASTILHVVVHLR